jgi:hypothetical protein
MRVPAAYVALGGRGAMAMTPRAGTRPVQPMRVTLRGTAVGTDLLTS